MTTGLCLRMMLLALLSVSCARLYPPELVEFTPYEHNPGFARRGPGHWDEMIRERGWILREGGLYHLWYTGYTLPESNVKHLGYATSPDGLTWTRYPDNPLYTDHWVEDMMVLKLDATYYMFAEGENDRAELLTSTDAVHWTWRGNLDVRMADGKPLSPGPFGTPTVFHEDGTWFLFYERDDEAIWLASSTDLKIWTNVQDEPVLKRGPEAYDQDMIALDQIVKYKGRYYAYYHGLIPKTNPQEWTSAVAVSSDLIHWEKYPGNPILKNDQSSPVLVDDGQGFRLYSMHPDVRVHFPRRQPSQNNSQPK